MPLLTGVISNGQTVQIIGGDFFLPVFKELRTVLHSHSQYKPCPKLNIAVFFRKRSFEKASRQRQGGGEAVKYATWVTVLQNERAQ